MTRINDIVNSRKGLLRKVSPSTPVDCSTEQPHTDCRSPTAPDHRCHLNNDSLYLEVKQNCHNCYFNSCTSTCVLPCSQVRCRSSSSSFYTTPVYSCDITQYFLILSSLWFVKGRYSTQTPPCEVQAVQSSHGSFAELFLSERWLCQFLRNLACLGFDEVCIIVSTSVIEYFI